MFSGYVLGWSRSSGEAASASGWLWLYDLGDPPAEVFGDAPHRAIYIPGKRNVPDATWSTDEVWLVRATYRARDLQAVRIEGKPTPSPKALGLQAWTWQSDEPLLRPGLETTVGFAFILVAAIPLMRSVSTGASSLHIAPVGDAKHR